MRCQIPLHSLLPHFALILLVFLPLGASASTFSVTATDDDDDGVCDATHCSFREALVAANATTAADLIDFGLLSLEDQFVTLSAPLPTVTQPLTIDGASHSAGKLFLCRGPLPEAAVLVLDSGSIVLHAFSIECPVAEPILAVSLAGDGSGSVTSLPAGIDCGTACSASFSEGTAVTLTPTPDPGSSFAGWSGDGDCADGSLTMDASRSCTATFDEVLHTLTVALAGGGTGAVISSPPGIDCGVDCSESYPEGSLVTLTATADSGSSFAGWSGDGDCTDGSVTMDTWHTCTATFDQGLQVLTVALTGGGGGVVSSIPSGIDCGSDCSESYSEGTVVTLTPTPDPSSTFGSWSGAADCADGTVTMDASHSCTARFDQRLRTLSVALAGSGSGTVTSSPTGIDCGADCVEDYVDGYVVTLTPTPDTGSSFVGWGGDADCGDGLLTMTADRACTATFEQDQPDLYSLVVVRSGDGSGSVTSSPGGIDCGVDCSESYAEGSVVSLTATADPDSTFSGWSGDADCSDGSLSMTADRACTATFDRGLYPLTVTRAGNGSGTVISSPGGIDCGADCSENYTQGSIVSLTATAEAGSTFAGWSGDADCSDGSLTMDSAQSCTATFDSEARTLSVSTTGTGSGTLSSSPVGIDCGATCSSPFDFGTIVTLTATADSGATFEGWSGDADCADGSVTMDVDVSCTATFDADTRDLTVTHSGDGSGTVISTPAGIDCDADCTASFIKGTVVTLTAVPGPGSSFGGWGGHADCADGELRLNTNRTCTVTFESQGASLLSVSLTGNGRGSVVSSPPGIDCGADCSEPFDQGTQVALTATPEFDSRFLGWSGGSDCNDGVVTVTGNTSCSARYQCRPNLVVSDMTITEGEHNASLTIVSGSNVTIDGGEEPVVFMAGTSIAFENGTQISGAWSASLESNPCR